MLFVYLQMLNSDDHDWTNYLINIDNCAIKFDF